MFSTAQTFVFSTSNFFHENTALGISLLIWAQLDIQLEWQSPNFRPKRKFPTVCKQEGEKISKHHFLIKQVSFSSNSCCAVFISLSLLDFSSGKNWCSSFYKSNSIKVFYVLEHFISFCGRKFWFERRLWDESYGQNFYWGGFFSIFGFWFFKEIAVMPVEITFEIVFQPFSSF